MSIVCASCGQETPGGFPRCANCGAELASAPAREERKVVTVLFCDLVGSTARAEGADPEDVRALLSAYHERVRRELERFGGTVEKFIGDAVMALFGAPTAHEDDPERAVRAALAIRDWAQEKGDLQVRIGITTGEALVSVSANPQAGEAMASGDVVNTAARLQSAAPINGIVVDETTHRATERVIDYDARDPVEAKGKTEPVAVWEAQQARARVQVEREGRAPLVGRERELDVLLDALRRVREDREPQLVTLVGVPGIGKSRLVYELFKAIETGGELTFWRQGRSLPYGEGVSFWALGEIVKAQAGIFETDDAEEAETKLRDAIGAFISDAADAQWLERHLRPLVGLEAAVELAADRRSEAFAAWRRFLEALAEERPLVLVFEDLHFADEGLLDFVDHLVDWASGVPLLVVATARPELLSRRAGWGGGKANAATLSLAALSEEDTSRLVHALLDRPVLAAELQETLIERAGGNPLYAEEYVRMLEQRDPAAELPLPETVQGLIAARIDSLDAREKTLLQDAAVLGRVFWLGATAVLGDTERRLVEERLHALERKEFVRRERRSSVAGETEYAFRHLLVRDVAYGQIPRLARAERHVAAARWIESLGRSDDHAEMLAHHYRSALELLGAAGRPAAHVAEPARLALRVAGDRAFGLNAFPAAAHYYAEALELWPHDDPDRAELLFSLARARHVSDDKRREQALEEAREALLAAGEPDRAAQADSLLAELWWERGDRDRCDVHITRAQDLVQGLPASPAKALVLGAVAHYRALARDVLEAIRSGEKALAMAEELGLPELQARALNSIGIAKAAGGDASAISDLEQSIEIALAARSLEAARSYNNLAAVVGNLGDLRRSAELILEAVRVGEALGGEGTLAVSHARANRITDLFHLGNWHDFLPLADDYIRRCEAGEAGHTYMEGGIRGRRAKARLARGDVEGAVADVRKALERAREVKDPQQLFPSLARAARVLAEVGRIDAAAAFGEEVLASVQLASAHELVDLAFAAEAIGCIDALKSFVERKQVATKWNDVLAALLARDYAIAADRLHDIGDLYEEAAARLRAAERLIAEGRRAEADPQLERALSFFRSVGATRYVREGESLLAESA